MGCFFHIKWKNCDRRHRQPTPHIRNVHFLNPSVISVFHCYFSYNTTMIVLATSRPLLSRFLSFEYVYGRHCVRTCVRMCVTRLFYFPFLIVPLFQPYKYSRGFFPPRRRIRDIVFGNGVILARKLKKKESRKVSERKKKALCKEEIGFKRVDENSRHIRDGEDNIKK